MKRLKYTDPYNFIEKEIEFDDLHYELAEIIRESLNELDPTPIFVGDGILVIGVTDPPISEREPGTSFKGKYRITIEKFG